MEDDENKLGGGPPSLEQEQEAAAKVEELTRRLQASERARDGVQEAPRAIRLAREDLLLYQLLGSKVEAATLKKSMYQRELQHAEVEFAKANHEASLFMRTIAAQHNVDFRYNTVTDDGYIVPLDPRQRQLALEAMLKENA